MSTQEIVSTNQTLSGGWGDRDGTRELVVRLRRMLPTPKKAELVLTDNELAALAQASIMEGLNPLTGEIYFLKRYDRHAKQAVPMGIYVGVKGIRRKAREQIARQSENANFWCEYREIVDAAERKLLEIPEGAIAVEARLYDSLTIRDYTGAVKDMASSGAPWEVIAEMFGTKPFVQGIGIVKSEERPHMPHAQLVRKRAEMHALRQRFDIHFDAGGIDDGSNDTPQWVIENVSVESQDATDDETASRLAARCTCDHTFEEHGIGKDGPCEIAECDCEKFTDARLAKGKKALGRDGGGID